jgi:hypothetical protein
MNKVVNGTTYHKETPSKLVRILERIRKNGTRCRFHYGDKDGTPWEYEGVGRLGRSMGPMKVPITLHNISSVCGPALMDNHIIKVTETRGDACLYDSKKRNV